MKEFPRVYAIVLNWNRYEHTQRCLESLVACSYTDLKVVVVDNASADDSGHRIAANFPQFLHIQNRENVGFARGCNVGIREALTDPQCAYVLLINNDAIFLPNGLHAAVSMASARRAIGLVGGKVLQSPRTKKIWYAGGYINRWRGQAMIRGLDEIDLGQYDEPCRVGFATGGLMLIKRELLETVGMLPEEYFFGVEEWDFSLTAQKYGYEIWYCPSFGAYHKGDGSHSNYDPKYVYNYYRNKLIFQEKFLPRWVFPIWKQLFVLYGKFLAVRHRQKLASRDQVILASAAQSFALSEAVKDHGNTPLSEGTLREFVERLAVAQACEQPSQFKE